MERNAGTDAYQRPLNSPINADITLITLHGLKMMAGFRVTSAIMKLMHKLKSQKSENVSYLEWERLTNGADWRTEWPNHSYSGTENVGES